MARTKLSHESVGTADHGLRVQITPAVQRHYAERGINADLTAAAARHRYGYCTVARGRAPELLADAEEQRVRGGLPKGMRPALLMLAKKLRGDLGLSDQARDRPVPEAALFAPAGVGETDRFSMQIHFQDDALDPVEARRSIEFSFRCHIHSIRRELTDAPCQSIVYRYDLDDEEQEELEEALATIERLAATARLVRVEPMHKRVAAYRAAIAARNDEPLQRLLANAQRRRPRGRTQAEE